MRKLERSFISLLVLLSSFQGCKQDGDPEVKMWQATGFPRQHQSFDFLIFTSAEEGFCFVTNFFRDPYRAVAHVYKTADGGTTWKSISSNEGLAWGYPAKFDGKYVFIQTFTKNKKGVFEYYLSKYDIMKPT